MRNIGHPGNVLGVMRNIGHRNIGHPGNVLGVMRNIEQPGECPRCNAQHRTSRGMS